MKKLIIFLTLGFSFSTLFNSLHSQVTESTVSLKKGEILDVLLLSQNKGAEDALQHYFKTAFPVAKRMTYQPLPGFKVLDHSEGNIRPNSLVLGSWSDLTTRESFLTEIVKEVPDFHEQRRDIWSYFALTYYEMTKDTEFIINRDKHHVATSFWLESEETSSDYIRRWQKKIKNSGGEIIITLKEGKSPFGYLYAPSYLFIHAWDSETDFLKFKAKMEKVEVDNVQHLNEFIVQ